MNATMHRSNVQSNALDIEPTGRIVATSAQHSLSKDQKQMGAIVFQAAECAAVGVHIAVCDGLLGRDVTRFDQAIADAV